MGCVAGWERNTGCVDVKVTLNISNVIAILFK